MQTKSRRVGMIYEAPPEQQPKGDGDNAKDGEKQSPEAKKAADLAKKVVRTAGPASRSRKDSMPKAGTEYGDQVKQIADDLVKKYGLDRPFDKDAKVPR